MRTIVVTILVVLGLGFGGTGLGALAIAMGGGANAWVALIAAIGSGIGLAVCATGLLADEILRHVIDTRGNLQGLAGSSQNSQPPLKKDRAAEAKRQQGKLLGLR